MRTKLMIAILFVVFQVLITQANAQCSICTKTAAQLGEKKAESLNTGIIYLMLTPFAIAGYIGFRWWKNEKETGNQ